jgi:hypothetical protein
MNKKDIGTCAHIIVPRKAFHALITYVMRGRCSYWVHRLPDRSGDRRILIHLRQFADDEVKDIGATDSYRKLIESLSFIVNKSNLNWEDFDMLLMEEDKSDPS